MLIGVFMVMTGLFYYVFGKVLKPDSALRPNFFHPDKLSSVLSLLDTGYLILRSQETSCCVCFWDIDWSEQE